MIREPHTSKGLKDCSPVAFHLQNTNSLCQNSFKRLCFVECLNSVLQGDVHIPNGLSTSFFALIVILWNMRFGTRLNTFSLLYPESHLGFVPLMYVSHKGRRGQGAVCRASGAFTPCPRLTEVGSRSACPLVYRVAWIFSHGYTLYLLLPSFSPSSFYSGVCKGNNAKDRPKAGFYTLTWISCYSQFGIVT